MDRCKRFARASWALDLSAGVSQRDAAPVTRLEPTGFHAMADDALKLLGCPDAAPDTDHQDRPPLHRLAPRVVSEGSTKARREGVGDGACIIMASFQLTEANLCTPGCRSLTGTDNRLIFNVIHQLPSL